MHRTGSEVFGVLAQNCVHTYASLIAAWLTGKSYVPINPSYPIERIRTIVEEAGISTIFYGEANDETEELAQSLGRIEFVHTTNLPVISPFNTYPSADKTAYILFTSGTTGKPKGVPITFGNLQAFLEGFNDLGYELGPDDRFLQMFELTFDLSVMSFMVPLCLGASFYTLPSGMIKTLGLYQVLDAHEITFALMVPSAINLLAPYLDDVELPHLRYSQFCGEALKMDMLQKWMPCVPNARIDNVYGPTEATIYCTYKTVEKTTFEADHLHGVAGIGKAMKHVNTGIFLDGKPVDNAGVMGELCINGAQVTPGYLNNPEQNAKSFVEYHGLRYYLTGDIAVAAGNGDIFYIGRTDDQVKIQGFRVELSEIEHAARQILPGHHSVAIGFQDLAGNWLLALFIQNLTADAEIIRSEIGTKIPEYMVPHLVLDIEEFPLNSNGKTDKKTLRSMAAKNL